MLKLHPDGFYQGPVQKFTSPNRCNPTNKLIEGLEINRRQPIDERRIQVTSKSGDGAVAVATCEAKYNSQFDGCYLKMLAEFCVPGVTRSYPSN
jgi:hypothetical protein